MHETTTTPAVSGRSYRHHVWEQNPTPKGRMVAILYAHLFHDFAELAGVLDSRLTPVFGTLGSCGSFGVEQACPDEESHKIGLFQAIVAPFPVQLHTQERSEPLGCK